jgi:hypothetical protein
MTLRNRIIQLLEPRLNKKFPKEELEQDVDKILKLVEEIIDKEVATWETAPKKVPAATAVDNIRAELNK